MIYPWRQIGRVAKQLAKSPSTHVYVFTLEVKDMLREYLMERHDRILLKDLQRDAYSIEEDASRSIHQNIRWNIGKKCSILAHRKMIDIQRARGHGRFRQSPSQDKSGHTAQEELRS